MFIYIFVLTNKCSLNPCSDSVEVCGKVSCVSAVVKDSVLALECLIMLYIYVRDVMDVVFVL